MYARLLNKPLLAGSVSGLLLGATFPATASGFIAFIALIPLLLFGEKRPFTSGLLCGALYFAISLYWVNIVMVTYGHLPLPVAIMLSLCLVGYLSLYCAVTYWGACRLSRFSGISRYILFPFFWVIGEYIRTFMLTGFPWGLIGYSQSAYLPMIQSSDIFGVYGVGCLILLVNGAFANTLETHFHPKRISHLPRKSIANSYSCIVTIFFVLNLGYGYMKLNQQLDEVTLQVGIAQGNVDQSVKWNPDFKYQTVQDYLSLSRQAQEQGADLIVWPESATPFLFQEDGANTRNVEHFASTLNGGLLFGSPAYRKNNAAMGEDNEEGEYTYLNSAYLLSENGTSVKKSDKVHLVPFGEYVPLSSLFPFVRKLVYGIGDFSSGENRPMLFQDGAIGVLVCYESIFPAIARRLSLEGATLLVNITNDAWFGRSTAPYQHLQMSSWRAVENRKWLVRSANTGVSAVVSPVGEVVATTPLFEQSLLVTGISHTSGVTLYTQFGDLLPWLAFLFLVVIGLMGVVRQKNAD